MRHGRAHDPPDRLRLVAAGLLIPVLLAAAGLSSGSESGPELAYDDGSAEFGFRSEETVAAVRFDNPQRRTLTELRFYTWGESVQARVYVLNARQRPIHSRTVTTPGARDWFTVPVPDLTPPETFYVGWEWLRPSQKGCPPCTWLGVDTNPPHHYRSYLGSLGNLRLKKDVPTDGGTRQEDYMIRAVLAQQQDRAKPFRFSNPELNDDGTQAVAAPGGSVKVELDYQIWDATEPYQAIKQIVLQIGDHYRCVYDAIPGPHPGDAGHISQRMPVPTEPRNYGVIATHHAQYGCEDALQSARQGHGRPVALGVVQVQSE